MLSFWQQYWYPIIGLFVFIGVIAYGFYEDKVNGRSSEDVDFDDVGELFTIALIAAVIWGFIAIIALIFGVALVVFAPFAWLYKKALGKPNTTQTIAVNNQSAYDFTDDDLVDDPWFK